MSNQTKQSNPSLFSYYVNDSFYSNLIDELSVWDRELELDDPITEKQCKKLIIKECRLLDEYRFDEFLSLYTDETLYWIPITPGGGDPRIEVSHAFDDRRRLEDRIYRLRTGYAYSQLPMSRTRRMVSNFELGYGDSKDIVFARCNFLISELRVGESRQYSGWYGFKLQKIDEQWKIAVKMVNLINSDQSHENMTFML
ncbi:aromatic-ring-hydroxylating dioxygenase subunit beta [Bacillus sp. V3B]|uniref:aromatic-ring-hydroxylating dioxygenase subunit beta n=1 Tax=Bacillus sp. V3B TaxID=2804915 RepID=UPI00210DA6E8|nr:aromatic-ring-hydroxylating dioxygenase subunit beta [Bacillus sp. V3B]MCQ6277074.1 aromatic-ring-hydroxylating dioxygenase subunit beta [Bacillus sp. V3B]